MREFKDKIVITGAASDMGRKYALEFARLGAKLAINDYADESLHETVTLVRRQSKQLLVSRAFDVSDKGDPRQCPRPHQ